MGLLGSARPSFGQVATAPDLGAAGTYGLFTSVGAVGNTGSNTLITGDIGTNSGAVTGFTPAMYSGTVQVQNIQSADAAKGVAGAYTSANDAPGAITLSSTSLGNGQTLTGGVYLSGATSTITGDLVLDAQNDPNALFIIKVDGALSTAQFSNVRLINAAAWQNVYWRVTGQVDIGTQAGFKGTILGNGNINLLDGAVLQGHALTQSGAISVTNTRVTTSLVPLPVELTAFTAERRRENALLRWTTASERNNAYFAVQSSTDGARYVTVGKVGGHGSTSSPQAYAWTDAGVGRYAAGAIYYRLVQVDADSSKHYSPVRTLTVAPGAGMQVQVYPSPSRLPCCLRIDARQAGPATLRLTNALGHQVAEYQFPLVKGSNSLPFEEARALAPGVYLVQVQQGAERQTVRLVRE